MKSENEMVDDIEACESRMLAVVDSNDEYITIADYEEDEEVVAYLGHAGSTIWMQSVRAF